MPQHRGALACVLLTFLSACATTTDFYAANRGNLIEVKDKPSGYVGFSMKQSTKIVNQAFGYSETTCLGAAGRKIPPVGLFELQGEDWVLVAGIGDLRPLPEGQHRLKVCFKGVSRVEKLGGGHELRTYGHCGSEAAQFVERAHFPEQDVQVVRDRVVGIRAEATFDADCGTLLTTVTADLSKVKTLDLPLSGTVEDIPMLEGVIKDGLFHEQVWAFEALCRAGRIDKPTVLAVLKRYTQPEPIAFLASKARQALEGGTAECVMPAPEPSK